MCDDTVTCAICGERMATITWKHLAKHNITLAEYALRFPNHPIRSIAATQRKKEGAVRANAARKGTQRTDDVKHKIRETKRANKNPAWNKGKPKTDLQKQQLSETRKRLYESGQIVHWNTGNTTPDSVKQKIRDTALSQHRQYSAISSTKRKLTYSQKRANGWVHNSTIVLLNKLPPEHRALLNDPSWLYEQHITNQRTISSICVELGLHWKNSNKTVRAALEKFEIPIQYWHQASSCQQKELEEFITSLGFAINTRDRTIIRPLELDIVIPQLNIAIEYCGLYWHTTEFKDPDYHKTKYDMCRSVGMRLITIYSDEWLNQRPIVEQKLRAILGVSNNDRVFARKCNVECVDHETKREFFTTNHIQGDGPSSINIGLTYNQQLIAVMGFINNNDGTYILNRYATSSTVVGGFSKLLSYFVHTYPARQITTFADLRWSVGNLYEKHGFVMDGILPSDYEYVDGDIRVHKFNFRHSRLPARLRTYDPTKTEIENTSLAGIHRIYDCGKLRYKWTNPHA